MVVLPLEMCTNLNMWISYLHMDAEMEMDSPYRQDRDTARGRFNSGEFVEVHVSTSLKTCEERDPKNLYKKVHLLYH